MDCPAQDEANPPFWQNVVTVTQQLQPYNQIGAENKQFIPISSDGMDMNYFMDTTKCVAMPHTLHQLIINLA